MKLPVTKILVYSCKDYSYQEPILFTSKKIVPGKQIFLQIIFEWQSGLHV
jgi:hypothetical protein